MSKTDPTNLTWRLKERPGFTTVEFSGEINENVDFSELRGQLKGAVVFKLADVRRINSCGVREWVNFVRDLPGVTELTFTHCSPAIVTQINIIYNFRGPAVIRSFLAPYICEKCNREDERLLDVVTHFPGREIDRVPDFPCETCGAPMELDDLPERYLSFITEG